MFIREHIQSTSTQQSKSLNQKLGHDLLTFFRQNLYESNNLPNMPLSCQ